jgi:molecular chaperone DnaJ
MGGIFEEFFGSMGGFGFSHGPGGSRVRQGADLRYDLSISFMDAAAGTEREVAIAREVSCEACGGSGEQPGTGRQCCSACGGTGQFMQRQGFFLLQTVCPRCRGEGSRIEHPCEACRGHGRVRHSSKITVKVPAGIDAGTQLVLRGQGEGGERGGPPGDLYVFVSVAPHDFFSRSGNDLVCTVPISFPQAALGAQITVPGLDGEVEVAVPAGSQPGDEVRIRGKGLPDVRHPKRRGDQVVRLAVATPRKLSRRQRELLEQLLEDE